jgi:2-polyprenyl-3-methyl-5-hydroxy-6-metoxy-1,4-benzoquinol methylase/tetratricopeptide (TPR) repeat protein
MAARISSAKKQTWSDRGSAAIDAGDLATAEQCFREAIRADRRSARHHFHLALVLEARAKFGAAAEHLTQALRLNPSDADAARRLTTLLTHRPIPADITLDPVGLRAALQHDASASWLIVKLALYSLTAKGPLAAAIEVGKREGWEAAARTLCLSRTADALKNELFLEMLRSEILRDADMEYLLSAVRCVLLLETPAERFEDRDLLRFAITLMQQARANEYCWYASEAEEARLASEAPFVPRLLAGDVEESRKLLLTLLYRSLQATLGGDAHPEAFAKMRPKALRDAVQAALAEDGDLRARAQHVPQLGIISDETSRKVARQYEVNPYPRWTSLRRPPPGEEKRRLETFFGVGGLAFMDEPYNVLIAGCGTGHQAVHWALSAPNAQVTAVDLSVSALAYACKMAERYGTQNVEFQQADIQNLPSTPGIAGRFHIIECLGVLHHMADPYAGWRALIGCLAPQGKLLVGLYSATARRLITELTSDPAFPGPGCEERALRKFRRTLLDRPAEQPGGQLKLGPDFYSASEFRDLAAHVSERCVTLAEVRSFLAENSLAFRGFWIDQTHLDRFHRQFPAEPWPGRLEAWEEFEAANPHTFAAMYNFWCERA